MLARPPPAPTGLVQLGVGRISLPDFTWRGQAGLVRSAAFKRGVRALAAVLAALALWRAPHADALALRCALCSSKLTGKSASARLHATVHVGAIYKRLVCTAALVDLPYAICFSFHADSCSSVTPEAWHVPCRRMEERMQKQLAAAEEAIRDDMRRQLLQQRLALIERLEVQTVPPPAKPAPSFALEAALFAADPADVFNTELPAGPHAKQQLKHQAGWRQEQAGVRGRAVHREDAEPASSRDERAAAAQGAQTGPR